MKKVKVLAILNTLAFILHLSISYLTQVKAVNTKNVGEVSDLYPSMFTPAGSTFAIWGLIYIALAIFCLYHIIHAFKHDLNSEANQDLLRIGGLFVINNIATAAWLYAWTHEYIFISVLLIVIQLVTLIMIHSRLSIHYPFRKADSKLCTELPLSLYLGWISIATIANTASYLDSTGWDGSGITEEYWTVIMIGIATVLGVFMILARKNLVFGLVVLWALYGIIVKRGEPQLFEGDIISKASWIAMTVILITFIFQLFRSFNTRRPDPIFPSADRPVK